MRLYLDSSAIVKLVQREAETVALRRYLRRHRGDASFTCALSRVEVIRAVTLGGPAAIAQAHRQLSRLDQVALTTNLLDDAARLAPGTLLRSLDAIHLAAAQLAGSDLRAIISYDQRMAGVATQLGLPVQAPGSAPPTLPKTSS
jgi:predicted nucleic acid-binding protein